MSRIEDEKFMSIALDLARSQMGLTSPDPMVGAVVVKNGKVISKGWHARQGTPHGEAMAIKLAGKKAKGATLYLNLEPCCHFGLNPPCSKMIIRAGIKRVVAAMKDPNPLVAGHGFSELIEAGVEVDIGILGSAAKKLNEPFIKHITTKKPFVILKSAMSLDGKIATKTGDSLYISGKASRQLVHAMRVYVDAILTSVNTIKIDDPKLTVRDTGMYDVKKRNPKKIVIDPMAQTPPNAYILKHEPERTVLVISKNAPAKKVKKLIKTGATILKMDAKKGLIDLKKLMVELGRDDIMSIMVEAGGNFTAACLDSGIVDKVMYFIAPKIIGGKDAPTPIDGIGMSKLSGAKQLRDMSVMCVGEDVLVEAYVI
jgi:diaminohydroxyphosphoribosylaminopyrimidine deaminase/5-amino-6-(5-phosphoribosylamino)uracil reductase